MVVRWVTLTTHHVVEFLEYKADGDSDRRLCIVRVVAAKGELLSSQRSIRNGQERGGTPGGKGMWREGARVGTSRWLEETRL
jgi:hypothetical protein